MSAAPSPMLEAALKYAARGWHVFRLSPQSKVPLPGSRGLLEATTDADTIRQWWTETLDANIGLALAPSGLIAIDADGAEWRAKIAALEAQYGALPRTLIQMSGGGVGIHALYKAPAFPIRGSIGPTGSTITLRGRAYLVVAPSVHPSGGAYRWKPGDAEVAELTPTWLEAIRRRADVEDAEVPAPEVEPDWLASIAPEARIAAARAHLERELGEVMRAAPGVDPRRVRPGMTWDVTRTLVRGYAIRDAGAAFELLRDVYNPKCAPPWPEARLARHVETAYTAGLPEWGAALRPWDPRERLGFTPDAAPDAAPPSSAASPLTDEAPPIVRGYAAIELVDQIRADAKRAPVTFGIAEIDNAINVRAGHLVVLVGAPGAGKTSIALQFARHHAVTTGPAIVCSAELSGSEVGARLVSQAVNVSWSDAQAGQVSEGVMRAALDVPRLHVLDADDATLDAIEATLTRMIGEWPGQTPLVVIDYVQLLALSSSGRDLRERTIEAIEAIRRLGKRHHAAVIALAQPSRAAAKDLRSGELLGADAMGAGAETAQLERAAHVVLTLGGGEDQPDGTRRIELSLAKVRAGRGDRVIPLDYDGRRGLFQAAGAAVAPDALRAGRKSDRDAAQAQAAEAAVLAAAERAINPLSRENLAKAAGVSAQKARQAIGRMVTDGRLVEIDQLAARSRVFLVWTPERAATANMRVRTVTHVGGAAVVGTAVVGAAPPAVPPAGLLGDLVDGEVKS